MVSCEMNEQLVKLSFSEKIRKVLMDMHPSKALGLDRLPALFFQKFWGILRDDITRAALHILNE